LRFASKAPFSMDDLLRDFLAETGENLDVVDTQLVRFEQERTTSEYSKTSFASFTPSKELVALSDCRGSKR